MRSINLSSFSKRIFVLFAILSLSISNLPVYAIPSITTQYKNDENIDVYDFQCGLKNTFIYGDTLFYPKKIKSTSLSSIECQTWSMNLDGTNRKVLLEGSFARNIIPREKELYYIPTSPSLDQYSLGVRKIDMSTRKSSWVLEESISNFQIIDEKLFCVKDFSGFYFLCNCRGNDPSVICQRSTYRYIHQHNRRTFVFENTPYSYNVCQNFRVSLLDTSLNTTQLIASEGYDFLAYQDDMYYIDIKDQKIHKSSLTTLETCILSDIQATNMRMDEHYIYFVNCEMGLLRPEYHYYRMDHDGEDLTYICLLEDTQLPLGIKEKSYHIVGQTLVEINDQGQKRELETIPYGGTVRMVTNEAVYYTYSLDSTSENTEMGVYKITST
ncbi:MAG: hypothetical protein PHI40_05690 [Caldisericia bacterium]|nr:hypothetical protein [Caldisericia bacterium]MDD4614880.1 hypothetical protein [Caldisericia bacterium]